MAVATTGSITLQNFTRHPVVMKLISRVKSPGTFFQTHFKMGLGDAATDSLPAGIRTFTWDIFDNTRQLASVRPPKVGPKRGRPQKAGFDVGHIIRSHDSLPIAWEDVINTRPLGSKWGTLDRTGQNKIALQIKHWTQKYKNLREWMINRMLMRGGFAIKFVGDDHYLVDTGNGDKDITYNHPSAHRSQLALGPSSANLIDVSWDDPTADIMGQFLKINKVAERLTGFVVEDCFINSTTLSYLMNNTTLQTQGGTSNIIWGTADGASVNTIDGNTRKSGMTVRFRSMPWVTFHIYDGVLQKGDALADSRTEAETELLIPDGRALMTPTPSAEWIGFAEGSEPQRTRQGGPMEILKGFQTWQWPMDEPPGVELRFLDNFFPVPYNPEAWFAPTVVF